MILALDISTSITGAAVLGANGETLRCEAWDTRNPKTYSDIFLKAKEIERQLRELKTLYPKIEHIYVEKSLQSFRSGFSSAKTLSTLSAFNGIVSWLAYQVFFVTPEYIAAPSARKLAGIKISRGQKAKEVVLQFLLDNEADFEIEYTKQGNPKPGSYDRADALVVAKAGYTLCQNKKS